jgi:hypothetical protein
MEKPEEKKVEGKLIWVFCMHNGAKILVEIPEFGHGAKWRLEDLWSHIMEEHWTWLKEVIVGGGPVLFQLSEISYILENDLDEVLMILGGQTRCPAKEPALFSPGRKIH